MNDINWTLRSSPRIAWFLATQAIQRRLDRRGARRARELDLADAVLQQAPAGDTDAVLRVMDEFSRSRRWLMSMGPRKGAVVADLLRDTGASNVLEVGTYCGYTAVLLGAQLAARGGRLVTLEKSRRNAAVARQIIEHAGLAGVVDVRHQVLQEAIGGFTTPFDLVLLDHWKDEYLPDLKRLEAASLLHGGTVVVADNVGFFRVDDYLGYVRTSGRYASRYVESTVEYHDELPDGIEISTFRA